MKSISVDIYKKISNIPDSIRTSAYNMFYVQKIVPYAELEINREIFALPINGLTREWEYEKHKRTSS